MAASQLVGSGNTSYVATGNKGYTTDPKQAWLNRQTIANLEEVLLFHLFGTMPEIKNGYLTHQFHRFKKIGQSSITETSTSGSVAGASNKTGVTQTEVHVTQGVISVVPRQFVIHDVIADVVEQFSIFSTIKGALVEFGHAMGRKADVLIQDTLYAAAVATGGPLTYVPSRAANGTETAITGLSDYTTTVGSKAKLTFKDVANGVRILRKDSARGFMALGDTYAVIMHTDVAYDLRIQTENNGFLELSKHVSETISKILKGMVGMIHGATVFETPHVQLKSNGLTGSNKVDVYPTYFIGAGAYGVLDYSIGTYVTYPNTADKDDPLGQRGTVGIKMAYNAVVLDNECFRVFVSTSTV